MLSLHACRRLLLGSFATTLGLLALSSHSQTVPSGQRLLNITDSTLVGARPDGSPGGGADAVSNREFDAIQPTWYPAWGGWTGPYTYDLSTFNSWVNWAQSRSRAVHMHMFAGPSLYFPEWFNNGSWSNADMENMLREMIRNVIQSNGNNTKVRNWNVVNEAISDSNGAYRPDADMKLNQLGWEQDSSGLSGSDFVNAWHPSYIRTAFNTARQHTTAKLELREYGVEFDPGSAKTRAFYQLAAHLLGRGAALDAVGLQAHLWQGDYDWDGFKEVVKKFKRLGLAVNVTEFDSGTATGFDAERQRQNFYEAYRAFREAGVEAAFTWGVGDGRDLGWRTNDQCLAFSNNYDPKQAYYGTQQALEQTRTFLVRARGSAGGEMIELRVGGVTVDYWVLSKEWSDYCFTGYSGSHNVRIAFVNDGNLYGQDKNVQIDYLRVNGSILQTENYSNTGGGAGGEWMWWNGEINYGTVSGPSAPLPNGTYRLTPRNSISQALDVNGNSQTVGSNVHLWGYGGWSNQEWTLTHTGSGWYEIKARHSGQCLDVSGSGSANGTRVQQWTDNDTAAQRWRLDFSGNGWFRITPACAQDKCLDAAGGSNGATVHIWGYGGAANQQWKLEAM